jgi:IS30 family transposase
MSNRLSMAQNQAIQALAATGKTHRAISKALGVDRGTVAKTLSQIQIQPPVWEANRLPLTYCHAQHRRIDRSRVFSTELKGAAVGSL